MKKIIIIAIASTGLIALPAHGQILGGGGLGGLGGQVGGVLNGPGGFGHTVGGAARGGGVGGIRLDRQVDRRSGRAQARGGGSAQGDALLGGTTSGLLGSSSANGSGSARGSGDAGIGLQALGTDQIRSTAGGLRQRGSNLVNGATGRASGTARGNGSASGSASGSGSGGGSGGADLLGNVAGGATGMLGGGGSLLGGGSAGGSGSGGGGGATGGGFGDAGFGSAVEGAADSAGSVSLEPGMVVRDTSGRVIGRVQDFRAAANGMIETVLVQVGDRIAAFPASNFTVSGETLVSAMSRGEVRREAAEQQQPAE